MLGILESNVTFDVQHFENELCDVLQFLRPNWTADPEHIKVKVSTSVFPSRTECGWGATVTQLQLIELYGRGSSDQACSVAKLYSKVNLLACCSQPDSCKKVVFSHRSIIDSVI